MKLVRSDPLIFVFNWQLEYSRRCSTIKSSYLPTHFLKITLFLMQKNLFGVASNVSQLLWSLILKILYI